MDDKTSPNFDPYAVAPEPMAGGSLALPLIAFCLMALASSLLRQYREVTIPATVAAGLWLGWILLKRK